MTLSTLYRVHQWRDDGIIQHEHKGNIHHGKRMTKSKIRIEHTCMKGPIIIKEHKSCTTIDRLGIVRSRSPGGLWEINESLMVHIKG